MMTERPSHLIDPVCGMTVDVAVAEAGGLLVEHEGRTYAFCGRGCRRTFVEGPGAYLHDAVDAAPSAAHAHDAQPVIDEGMRRWYESCSCCLSEAYPDIKAALDAERAAASAAPSGDGICEVAEREELAVP
jgi:Cu+-exporting ATPase